MVLFAGNLHFAQAQTVTQNNLGIWGVYYDNAGSSAFVSGPSTPPLGPGSLQISTGPNLPLSTVENTLGMSPSAPDYLATSGGYSGGKVYVQTNTLDNVPLNSVTSLSYSTYSPLGSTLAPYITIEVATGGSSTRTTTLVFDPANAGGQGDAVVGGTWQTWNALSPSSAHWWCEGTTANLCDGGSSINNPFTLNAFITANPNTEIVQWYSPGPYTQSGYGNFYAGGGDFAIVVGDAAGDPGWAGTSFNIDNVTIGTATNTQTFEFQPAATSTTTVSCPSVSLGSSTTCTATVTGNSPTGTVTFATSDTTGTFTTSSCTLSSSSCQVTYTDSASGTITATYSGDSINAGSSGTTLFAVTSPLNFGATCSQYVSGENSANTAIQNAINSASSGGTICIYPGTYPEQLTITKPISLVGFGSNTIIEPNTVSSTTTSYTTGASLAPIILAKGTTGANLRGFEVEGSLAGNNIAACAPDFFGVLYQDASGSILNLNVSGIELPPVDFGCQSGDAIYVQSNSLGSSTVSIMNNSVVNYQKNGITCNEINTYCNIADNKIQGAGPTPQIAQNGVEVYFNGRGKIINNTITGNSYTGNYAALGPNGNSGNYFNSTQATGVLACSASTSTLNISDNKINLNDIGIWSGNDGSSGCGGPTIASNNKLSGNYDYGIVFDSANANAMSDAISGSPVGLLGTAEASNAHITVENLTFTGVSKPYQVVSNVPSLAPYIAKVVFGAPQLVLDVNANVLNDQDSSYNTPTYWALDNFNRILKIYQLGVDNYSINFIDSGNSFIPAGVNSPGIQDQIEPYNGVAIMKGVDNWTLNGTFMGTSSFSQNGISAPSSLTTNASAGTFDSGASVADLLSSPQIVTPGSLSLFQQFAESFFTGITNDGYNTAAQFYYYSYTYNGLSGQQVWVDASNVVPTSSNAGDIVTQSASISGGVVTATANLTLTSSTSGEATLPSGTSGVKLSNGTVLNLAAAINTASGGEVTVNGNTIPLNGFTGGAISSVDLTAPQIVGGQSVIVSNVVTLNSGTSSAITLTNVALPSVNVTIPDGTTVLAPANWTGTIMPPTAVAGSGTPPAGFSLGSTVIEVGSPNVVLLFDQPVTLVLPATGTVGYKASGSNTWVQITDTCGGTYASPSDPTWPGQCSISNGTDTKILTYHFTTFGTMNPTSTSSSSSSSSSTSAGGGGTGGTGSGGSSAPVVTKTSNGYSISNIAQLDTFNVTLGALINGVENFISPDSAGISLNGTSYTLNVSSPVQIGSNLTATRFVELTNISYVPLQHTISLDIYSVVNTTTSIAAPATNSTAPSSAPATNNTAPGSAIPPAVNSTSPTTAVNSTPAPAANTTSTVSAPKSGLASPAVVALGVGIAIAIAIAGAYYRFSRRR